MTQPEIKEKRDTKEGKPAPDWPAQLRPTPSGSPEPATRRKTGWIARLFRGLLTLSAIAVAVPLGWMMWDVYMASPWTRDGTVRAYVVTMAPEISGRIVELPVRDNQFVRKGDLLMAIDPTNYEIAVKFAEAAVEQARAVEVNARAESERREKLTTLSTSEEIKQTYRSQWLSAEAGYRQAVANLDQARVNLRRTHISSPVNGYVTNLFAQLGDYVTIGQNEISLIDADSYWIDGYFEEINLERIRVGDPATVKLMGYDRIIRGHVNSIARGINVANAQPNSQGLANVNPIFTWVRLAQRVPVRIQIDELPPGVLLSAGMTATVQIDPRPGSKTGEAAVDQARDPPPPQPTPPQQRKEAQRKPVLRQPSPSSGNIMPQSDHPQAGSGAVGGAGGAGGGRQATPGEVLSGPAAMKQCMESWGKDTGMTKQEWRASCQRTLPEFPIIEGE